MNQNNIAFTFATSEVNIIGQNFIKITELCTGKLKLKSLYDQYLKENNPPENFWHDAVKKLELKIQPHYHSDLDIPNTGRLIVVANHAFGVADGVTMCSLISKIRQDYKIITHKVLRQADAVKEKIIPFDFSTSREAIKENINSRKIAEEVLKNDGVIVIFPAGAISTKEKLKRKEKAIDSEWKQFTAKLAVRTNSPVLPMYFEGQNSHLFHVANKMGQTFRYSLMMYELKRKIGDTINIHIGDIVPFETIKEICAIVPGPVSAEVTATQTDSMVNEGRRLTDIASNVVVKVPLTWDGLKACKILSQSGTKVNVTLCFSAAQALLAAKVGATFISPFVGRLDDIGHDGMILIEEIAAIYSNYPDTLQTEILVASIRDPIHLLEAAKLGADVATVPPQIIRKLASHPLTDKGLDAFLKDWAITGQTILSK